jgi:hypothetical protein
MNCVRKHAFVLNVAHGYELLFRFLLRGLRVSARNDVLNHKNHTNQKNHSSD